MLVIDDITVIIGTIILVVSIISPFINVLIRKLRTVDDDEVDIANEAEIRDEDNDSTFYSEAESSKNALSAPGISIIVTVDDEYDDLKNNLTLLLNQKYSGEYQLVVVMCSNNEHIDNILKSYKDNHRLYTTFIPSSSRYMSRRKLAITIGVKAAKYNWILLTDVDCRPNSDEWLSYMAENCNSHTDIVLGWSSFENDYKSSRIFDHSYRLYSQLAFAQRYYAYAYNGCNLMFRKNMFIEGKGFDGNLKFIRGEYDFIVNKFSSDTNTAVELRNKAIVKEIDLTDKEWKNKNLFYLSTRKHIDGTLCHRIFFNISMTSMIAVDIIDVASLVFAIILHNWILTTVAALALILTLILRGIILTKTLGRFIEEISVLKLIWLEQTMPLRNLFRILKYKSTDKYDFISHKI